MDRFLIVGWSFSDDAQRILSRLVVIAILGLLAALCVLLIKETWSLDPRETLSYISRTRGAQKWWSYFFYYAFNISLLLSGLGVLYALSDHSSWEVLVLFGVIPFGFLASMMIVGLIDLLWEKSTLLWKSYQKKRSAKVTSP